MATYQQGTTASLTVLWREYAPDGPLIDVNNIQITIVQLATGTNVIGPTAMGITHPATGTYNYQWSISPVQATGDYVILWTGNDVATSGAVQTSEIVTVSTAASEGSPLGLCSPWSPLPEWNCQLPLGAAAVTGTALQLASEILWGLTARRFGLCEITLRPCRRECYGGGWSGWANWWEYGYYPQPALIGGLWYNIACGFCTDGCSCSRISDVMLPGPVYEVLQVKVDGNILTKNVDYRLDDYRRLIRLGGQEWPLCNDLNLADTEPGTWSVTFTAGEPVPPLGRAAVSILAVEIAKMLICDTSCALPKPIQSLSRQGVNIAFLDPNEVFADGRTGLYLPDLFISTYNPNKLRQRSMVYDIDNLNNRRQLGTG